MKYLIEKVQLLSINFNKVKQHKVSYDPKQTKFKVTFPKERLEINEWHKYIHSQLR